MSDQASDLSTSTLPAHTCQRDWQDSDLSPDERMRLMELHGPVMSAIKSQNTASSAGDEKALQSAKEDWWAGPAFREESKYKSFLDKTYCKRCNTNGKTALGSTASDFKSIEIPSEEKRRELTRLEKLEVEALQGRAFPGYTSYPPDTTEPSISDDANDWQTSGRKTGLDDASADL